MSTHDCRRRAQKRAPARLPGRRFGLRLGLALALAATAATAAAAESGDFALRRARMVDTIVAETRLTRDWIGKSMLDQRILSVMRRIPRHEFVPQPLARFAYLNRPLPVGLGQTVSQPYIVALMTDLADIERGDKVLLVGIGGGYHAAIIERLAGSVSCIEMQPAVAKAAMARLRRLGHVGVRTRTGDPYYGWRGESNHFDAIIVRQAMDFIPRALVNQLKPGGRLVIPAGRSEIKQHLTVATKNAQGRVVERRVMPVRFTRMPGGPRI